MNPFHTSSFPDPFILATAHGYVAYATNGDGGHVQVLTSPDLVHWAPSGDAMPQLASWTAPGKVWAPEVAEVDGVYRMYYTSQDTSAGLQAIGVATADTPLGPFVDDNDAPLICELDGGGSIDASPHRAADGTRYLYWKNDGNAVGQDTWIWVQRLSDDGTELLDRPIPLFKQTERWEGAFIEGPFAWEHDGTTMLFYSGNVFADYAVGLAIGPSPTGPFTKQPEPILASNDVASGPGHCALIERGGGLWMAYHAWVPGQVRQPPGRLPWLSRVVIDGDDVWVEPPRIRPAQLP